MNKKKKKQFNPKEKKKKNTTENNTENNEDICKIYNNDWNLCFDEYKNNSCTFQKVKTMEQFLKANPELSIQVAYRNNFEIDINLLYNNHKFVENWPDFKNDLKNKPEYSLNCLRTAVHNVRFDQFNKINEVNDVQNMNNLVQVRILNYHPIIPIKNIKMNFYGKLITVSGYIIRVNKPQHIASILVFVCKSCKKQYLVNQKNGIYTLKKKCNICGGTKLEPNFSSYAKSIPWQIVRMQEQFSEENDNDGQIPRVIDIELYEDLVSTCMPGNNVTITGIVKMQGIDNGKIKAGAVSALYIEAVSVINNSNKSKNNENFGIELNLEDYKLIKDIHISLDILTLLVYSLCPSIYGQEMIKMALLLSLFGGSSNHTNLRNNIHILLLGDPGLGKSQMLKACTRVAPKGIYISGNCSTLSGLTVTLVKEAGQNDFALEPGALVLADNGCCCIDEFDKMSGQYQALLEVMEQQRVSIAKSSIIWSLPSRTSILAAANPIGGRYNKSKTLCQNVNMNQPLLSRFDLIFLLLDEANKELDNFLSEHIMLIHTGNEQIRNKDFNNHNIQINNQINSLKNRLIAMSKNLTETLSPSILRMYISYAQRYVKPKLSRVSATIIQKFYLNLRKTMNVSENSLSCNRQLEALIRLTEARAKLELREITTEQDAIDIIELMQHSILHLRKEKENHKFVQTEKSNNSATKTFLKLLTNEANEKNNLYSMDELKNLGMKVGLINNDLLVVINKLNDQGFLIKKSKNLYNFCTL